MGFALNLCHMYLILTNRFTTHGLAQWHFKHCQWTLYVRFSEQGQVILSSLLPDKGQCRLRVLSPPRVAFSRVGWFSRALAFQSPYYPWGKMGDYSWSRSMSLPRKIDMKYKVTSWNDHDRDFILWYTIDFRQKTTERKILRKMKFPGKDPENSKQRGGGHKCLHRILKGFSPLIIGYYHIRLFKGW